MNLKFEPKSPADDKQNIAKLKTEIHQKEKEIRQNLIDARKLQDENYPNTHILIQG